MNKYGAVKVHLDGMVFDSKHEANRWIELKYMERAHIIEKLERQVPFELIPAQERNGKLTRACKYIADFVYYDKEKGETVVEDAKGMRTDVYKIKKKMMLWEYGIEIKEV